ncbi:MAG TPA: cytochrome c3 family protein [Terriglobia bacterium]|nr:cytochrome c3 family protein [Terriglobia bacterium]
MTRGVRNPVLIQTLCALAFFVGTAVAPVTPARGAQAKQNTLKPPLQPVPFSHRRHCEKNIPCVLCHQTAATGETAGLPGADVCMACHQSVATGAPSIRKLAAYARQHKPVPWLRIYRIQDFVFFSHKRHAGAKVACAACHGKVCKSDVLKLEVKLSMKFCIDCHKASKASLKCNACHTLSM